MISAGAHLIAVSSTTYISLSLCLIKKAGDLELRDISEMILKFLYMSSHTVNQNINHLQI